MNLLLISNDNDLYRFFKNSEYFNVKRETNLIKVEEYEVIIISDNEINHNELFCIFEVNEIEKYSGKHIFYILSDKYDSQSVRNIYSICKMRNIIIIPSKLSIKQINNKVLEHVTPSEYKENRNVITFFGADSKVGTTMIAQSVAELLAKKTDIKIGLFFLNNNPSTNYTKNNDISSLDNIKIKLFNNILKSEELMDICIKEENDLYILPGIDYYPDFRQYHPEHIERLIELAAEKFNILIIDAGSNIDSGLAIASLKLAKIKYLVVTQQEAVRKNFERIEAQTFNQLNIDAKQFMLVINKYIKSNYIYNTRQMAGIYKMMLAASIPHLEFLGWQAEIERRTLIHYESESFNRQIDSLSRLIATQMHSSYKEIKKENIIKRTLNNIGGML